MVNSRAVARARELIGSRQYVLDSEWGEVQRKAAEQNTFLRRRSWEDYGEWHLGLTEGAPDATKARYAFAYGDFRRLHRSGIIACHYRAAEWRHKEIELAAHTVAATRPDQQLTKPWAQPLLLWPGRGLSSRGQ